MNLYVVWKGGFLLFGWEWVRNMRLNWVEIEDIEILKKGVDGLLNIYRCIFSVEFGILRELM